MFSAYLVTILKALGKRNEIETQKSAWSIQKKRVKLEWAVNKVKFQLEKISNIE